MRVTTANAGCAGTPQGGCGPGNPGESSMEQGVLEGKTTPRRRMFIGHGPTKGSRAASKGRGSSHLGPVAPGVAAFRTAACCDCYVSCRLFRAYGNQRPARCLLAHPSPSQRPLGLTDPKTWESPKGGPAAHGFAPSLAGGLRPGWPDARFQPAMALHAWGRQPGAMGQEGSSSW